jgi:hypothetical protein
MFQTVHPRLKSLAQVFESTSMLKPSPKTLNLYASLLKVILVALEELQSFRAVPEPEPAAWQRPWVLPPPKIDSSSANNVDGELYVVHLDVKGDNLLWDKYERRVKLCTAQKNSLLPFGQIWFSLIFSPYYD